MVKYADRGLVNDQFFVNNIKLFKNLFWFCNLFLVLLNQGLIWAFYFKHEKSFFASKRTVIICTEFSSSKFLVGSDEKEIKPLGVLGNPVRTIPLLFGIAMLLGIRYWRRMHMFQKGRRYNLMTFNQTVLLVLLIYTGKRKKTEIKNKL